MRAWCAAAGLQKSDASAFPKAVAVRTLSCGMHTRAEGDERKKGARGRVTVGASGGLASHVARDVAHVGQKTQLRTSRELHFPK